MEYSTCSYCCKQIADKDFDKENGRCYVCQERWREKRERRLEKDRINKRRDREENPEKYQAMRQIEIYCKACRCYVRKYMLWKHKKTAKHIRNGGPEMEEEERKMKEEEKERKRKEEEEKKKLEEAEEQIMIEKLKKIFKHVKIGGMV